MMTIAVKPSLLNAVEELCVLLMEILAKQRHVHGLDEIK